MLRAILAGIILFSLLTACTEAFTQNPSTVVDFRLGETPYQFLKDRVIPFYEEKTETELKLPANVSNTFLHRLSPLGKSNFFSWFDEKSMSAGLPSLLNQVDGAIYNLTSERVDVTLQTSHNKTLSKSQIRELARFGLFDLGLGLVGRIPNGQGEALFLPISFFNLRAFSGFDGHEYEDKRYTQLCSTFETNPTLFSHEEILQLFVNGYSPKHWPKEKNKQRILLDLLSIYIAESYKPLRLSLKRGENAYLSGTNSLSHLLLLEYFNTGGLTLHRTKFPAGCKNSLLRRKAGERTSCVVPASFSFFQCKNYRLRQPERLRLEEHLTEYKLSKHPELFQTLKSSLPNASTNLWLQLAYAVEDEKNFNDEEFAAIRKLTQFSKEETNEASKSLVNIFNTNDVDTYFKER